MPVCIMLDLGQKGVGKNVIEFGGTWDVYNACMVKWLDILSQQRLWSLKAKRLRKLIESSATKL